MISPAIELSLNCRWLIFLSSVILRGDLLPKFNSVFEIGSDYNNEFKLLSNSIALLEAFSLSANTKSKLSYFSFTSSMCVFYKSSVNFCTLFLKFLNSSNVNKKCSLQALNILSSTSLSPVKYL